MVTELSILLCMNVLYIILWEWKHCHTEKWHFCLEKFSDQKISLANNTFMQRCYRISSLTRVPRFLSDNVSYLLFFSEECCSLLSKISVIRNSCHTYMLNKICSKFSSCFHFSQSLYILHNCIIEKQNYIFKCGNHKFEH